MEKAVAKKRKGASTRLTSPLPNPVTLAFGQNLKLHREALKKTQLTLAYEAEIERSRISKMECGYINPSLLTLATLCHCMKLTLSQLFEGITETMPPISEGGTPRRTNQATLEKVVPVVPTPSKVAKKASSKL